MRKFWLLFSQMVTACIAVLFVVQTFKPQWLPKGRIATEVQTRTVVVPANTGNVSQGFATAVQIALPSVVSISSSQRQRSAHMNDPWFRFFFGDEPSRQNAKSLGSGVIVTEDGYLLTNHHVIESADDIKVTLENGKRLQAKLVGTDPDTDLAVLKVSETKLPFIRWGEEKDIRVGDIVLAIGNPYGVGQTVTQGIISALGRSHLGVNTYENFIQTDAAINPGNSGGALVNSQGQLIGINTLIYSQAGGGSVGIGFAIPISMAKQVLQEIITTGKVSRGYLGVELQDVAPELGELLGVKHGVVVVGVLANGSAARAGVIPGDVITSVNNSLVHNTEDFTQVLSKLKPGDTVELMISRNKKSTLLLATLVEKPPAR